MTRTAHGPNVWVVRRGAGFVVRVERGRLVRLRGATQRSAIAYGRSLARAYHSELIVQGENGHIRLKDSYGPDSVRRKG
jgi:hypothetical protein